MPAIGQHTYFAIRGDIRGLMSDITECLATRSARRQWINNEAFGYQLQSRVKHLLPRLTVMAESGSKVPEWLELVQDAQLIVAKISYLLDHGLAYHNWSSPELGELHKTCTLFLARPYPKEFLHDEPIWDMAA